MEGGSPQINSGRTTHRSPRDAKLWDFLIEARTTDKKTYSLDAKEFIDIRNQAFRTPPGCQPGMQIDFETFGLQTITIPLLAFQEMQIELDALRVIAGNILPERPL